MSTIQVPSIGLPGEVIEATKLNDAFSAFEVTINQTNLRTDSVHTYHLSTPAIQQQAGNVSNASDTFVTYTGTSYQAITHGTNAINTGLILLANDSTLRVHWHQYIDAITVGIPDIDAFTSFKLQWDIGAGYVDIPDLMLWAVWPYHRTSVVSEVVETTTHNMTGSWWYQNTTGSTITILGIRLMVRPSNAVLTDSVDLGEGNISHMIQVR